MKLERRAQWLNSRTIGNYARQAWMDVAAWIDVEKSAYHYLKMRHCARNKTIPLRHMVIVEVVEGWQAPAEIGSS